MELVDEHDRTVERVAALDIGKSELTACVRVPADGAPGRRAQEVREYTTLSRSLLELADWLRCQQVTLVSMEATSDYWKPVYYLLEAEGFTCWLLNARHVKNVPGRAKTDRLDAVWLAKVTERGMCRPSLVQPPPLRTLRNLTRYRRSLVRERTREQQRLEKLLEDAQIKISSVTKLLGVSTREMLEAMVAGERDPAVLANMARGRLRGKTAQLREALTGHFTDEHAFLVRMMLDRIDALSAQVDQVGGRVEEAVAPFAREVERLDEVTGVGRTAAQEIIAEVGVDMTRFPTAAHLVSWAKFAPLDRASAGRRKSSPTGKGDPWLAATLGEVVAATARTQTFLGARYRRLARRRGKKRAIVAVGNSVLTTVWHLLSDPDARYHDLGPDHYQPAASKAAQQRDLVRRLERLTGNTVVLQPAAA